MVSIGMEISLGTKLTDGGSSAFRGVEEVSPAKRSGRYRSSGGRDEDHSSSMRKYFS